MEELQRQKRNVKSEEFLQMEGLLTLDELTKTLFESLKGSSAPGWDRFTVNWLRTFWSDLSELVTRALSEMYTLNELIGIFKKAPGNYRPISLLSVFYKLASACITRRIKPVLQRKGTKSLFNQK